MQNQLKKSRTVWAVGALLLLSLTAMGAQAKTTAFTGTMKTKVDFNRTYTVEIADPLQTLTLSVPIPQSGSIFSYAVTASQAAVDSNLAPTSETDVTDNYGNALHVIEYDNPPPETLTVHVNITGILLAVDLSHALPAAPFPVVNVPDDAAAYLQPTEHVQSDSDTIRTLAQTITVGAKDESGAAKAISRWMLANIAYDAGGPTARTPALTTLADHKARCDGWGNLYLALARASGIPARYVGGYWITPQISYTGAPAAPSQIASDHTHTWIELWFPGAGWVPYEPQLTAGFVDTHHLRVWEVPDSGMTSKTLNFTADSETKPNVTLKLTSAFANLTDTLALTSAGVTDPADAKSLYIRK